MNSDIEVICIQESWFNASVVNAEITRNSDYEIFRSDRSQSSNPATNGGGVFILAKKSLNAQIVPHEIDSSFIEMITIEFTIGTQLFILSNIYLVPYNQQLCNEELKFNLDHIFNKYRKANAIILGDFNMGCIGWEIGDDDIDSLSPISNNNNTPVADDFLYNFSALNLSQINSRPNSNGVFLDLCLVSNPAYVMDRSGSIIQPFDKSSLHHNPALYEISCPNISIVEDEMPDLYKTNLRKSQELVSKYHDDYPFIINSVDDIEILISKYASIVHSCSRKIAPKRNMTAPWLANNDAYAQARKTQKKYYNIFKKHNNSINKQNYLEKLNQTKSIYSNLRDKYYERVINDSPQNPSALFTLARSRKTSKETLPNDMILNKNPIPASDRDKTICEHLHSIFRNDPFPMRYVNENNEINFHKLYDDFYVDSYAHLFTDFNIIMNETTLDKLIKEIDIKKDAGPHQISIHFINYNYNIIKPYLLQIINFILERGVFPESFKKSYIVPIPKKGSSRCIENYRGIAIQSILPKIIEKHLKNLTSERIESLISPFQHGFRPKYSTISNLLEMTHAIQTSFKSKQQMDTIYFDFSKAFDRIDHYILSKKLARLSLPFELFRCIMHFTTNRKYFLKINSRVTLLFFIALSGIPQGSHLGPLLYLIFCNDLPLFLKNVGILLFADDTKIFRSIGTSVDRINLQQAIDALAKWAENNKLEINGSKTVHVSFSGSSDFVSNEYYINGIVINRHETVKDLGILFDRRLSFTPHIVNISKRAYQLTGAIYRLVKDIRCPNLSMKLYKSFVLPILEYGSIIWDQGRAIDNLQLEKSLHMITRISLNVPLYPLHPRYLNFQTRINLLNFNNLDTRRKYQLASIFLKIINGDLNAPSLLAIMNSCYNTNIARTRRPNYFIQLSTYSSHKMISHKGMSVLNYINYSIDIESANYLQIKKFIYK